MVFMLTVTVAAMALDLQKYITAGNLLLTFVAACIFLLSAWLVVEGCLRFRKDMPARAQVAQADP